jgi:hypothetical protein
MDRILSLSVLERCQLLQFEMMCCICGRIHIIRVNEIYLPFYIKLDELADNGTVLFCCCEKLDSLYGSTKGVGR